MTQRQLARRARCSLSWIANAEGGYVPRRSRTLARVLRVLHAHNDERPLVEAGAVQNAAALADRDEQA